MENICNTIESGKQLGNHGNLKTDVLHPLYKSQEEFLTLDISVEHTWTAMWSICDTDQFMLRDPESFPCVLSILAIFVFH